MQGIACLSGVLAKVGGPTHGMLICKSFEHEARSGFHLRQSCIAKRGSDATVCGPKRPDMKHSGQVFCYETLLGSSLHQGTCHDLPSFPQPSDGNIVQGLVLAQAQPAPSPGLVKIRSRQPMSRAGEAEA